MLGTTFPKHQKDTLIRLGKVLKKPTANPDLIASGDSQISDTSESLKPQTINTSYLQIDPALHKSLDSTIVGLIRSSNIQGALVFYRESIVKEAKNTVRSYLPSSDPGYTNDGTTLNTSSMAENHYLHLIVVFHLRCSYVIWTKQPLKNGWQYLHASF